MTRGFDLLLWPGGEMTRGFDLLLWPQAAHKFLETFIFLVRHRICFSFATPSASASRKKGCTRV